MKRKLENEDEENSYMKEELDDGDSSESEPQSMESSDEDSLEAAVKEEMDDIQEEFKNEDSSESEPELDDQNEVSSDEDTSDENVKEKEEISDNEKEVKSEEDNKSDGEGNEGWADAMQQVLNVGKVSRPKKTFVLSKAKKIRVPAEGIKEEPRVKPPTAKEINEKKAWITQSLVRPDVLNKDDEKALQKIAVRGVVQLFNAVRKHQGTKIVDEKKKNRKTKPIATSDNFLKLLKEKNEKIKDKNNIEEEEEDAKWSVLRDNFMITSKLKNWDKEDENKNESGVVLD